MKRNLLRILYFCLVIFFIVAGLLSSRFFPNTILQIPFNYSTPSVAPTVSPQSTIISKVIRVIDGDTIEIEDKQIVRYIGIDTPETKHPNKNIECFGKEASAFNKRLIEGKQIRIEKDISETDKYKRLLRYVWLFDNLNASQSGLFVNDYLVRQGYAYVSTFPPDVKYNNQFIDAQNEAQKFNRGLWSKCNTNN